MLNKELLLRGEEKEEFPTLEGGFVFKVGLCSYAGDPVYGYLQYNYKPSNGGYTSRVPYWNFNNKYGVLTRYHITHFITEPNKWGTFSISDSAYTGSPSEMRSFRFRRVFPHEENDSYTSYYIDIPEEYMGKIVGYLIDPPQTGTWIQRHSNRSKVLCRRSSLGGSRC